MDMDMSISERIFDIMDKKKLKSSQLSAHLGVRHSVVSSWNTRGTTPKTKNLIGICEFLGVSMQYLLTGEDDSNSDVFPKDVDDITEDEKTILKLYRMLPRETQIELRGELKGRIAAMQK